MTTNTLLFFILTPNAIDNNEPEIKEAFGIKHSKQFQLPLIKVLEFAQKHKIVSMTYVTQLMPDEDDNMCISMQEIADVFESGEMPEDLSFF